MSMQRLPGPDGIHWPLILNIPGETSGDDLLQTWTNHRTLSDADSNAFLLDQVWVSHVVHVAESCGLLGWTSQGSCSDQIFAF